MAVVYYSFRSLITHDTASISTICSWTTVSGIFSLKVILGVFAYKSYHTRKRRPKRIISLSYSIFDHYIIIVKTSSKKRQLCLMKFDRMRWRKTGHYLSPPAKTRLVFSMVILFFGYPVASYFAAITFDTSWRLEFHKHHSGISKANFQQIRLSLVLRKYECIRQSISSF